MNRPLGAWQIILAVCCHLAEVRRLESPRQWNLRSWQVPMRPVHSVWIQLADSCMHRSTANYLFRRHHEAICHCLTAVGAEPFKECNRGTKLDRENYFRFTVATLKNGGWQRICSLRSLDSSKPLKNHAADVNNAINQITTWSMLSPVKVIHRNGHLRPFTRPPLWLNP